MSKDNKLVRILDKIGEKRSKSILRAGIGALWGTIDCVASGLPLITIGLPIWEHIQRNDIYTRDDRLSEYAKQNAAPLSEHIKSLVTYGLGASIPFIIRYHKEITDLSEKIIYR